MQALTVTLACTEETRLNYLVHLPPAPPDGGLLPTIVFLHGSGENGDDPSMVLRQGLPAHIEKHPEFPFVVIAPQCPAGTWWPELKAPLARLLEQCCDSLPIDRERLYLTGLSLGGFGCWYLGAHWPQRFAAIAPICGGGKDFHGFPDLVARLKETPVWAFHGARDEVIPLGESQQLVERLLAEGGQARLTVYPEAGHDSWTQTYADPALYAWFLQHRRPAP